jgi:two-component system, OmpR family, sensor histidine kinase ChvG
VRARGLSRLTLRILAVNLLTLLVPLGGALSLSEYRNELISNEMDSLRSEARLFADAVAEGAAVALPDERRSLSPDQSTAIIRRLAATGRVRAQLYDVSGALMSDSQRLVGFGGIVSMEPLQPFALEASWSERLLLVMDDIFAPLTNPDGLTDYPDSRFTANPQAFPDIVLALEGEAVQSLWDDGADGFMMSVAAPVQLYRQVLGVVVLLRDSSEIRQSLRSVRLQLFNVVGLAMVLTIGLSFYLARTIARPVTQLARAADNLRKGNGRRDEIPDFTARRDEIGDLSGALRQMTQSQRLRMDAIESFAADVAHEIKNPLTSVRSAVETAARVKDPERLGRLLLIIRDDVDRLDRLITDISDASRLDAELNRSEVQEIDLGAMLAALLHNHIDTRREGQPELTLEVIGAPQPHVRAIEGRLAQVFRNLIGNAVSFSPPGARIALRLTVEPRQVELTVEDEGPGIPDGKFEAIFDRFYSERPTGEKFGTHSGLGLAISRQIIEAHNGTIFASNRRDALGNVLGARFTVRLPRVD